MSISIRCIGPDPETPIEETLRALDSLVRAGKVRYVGCSNYPAWQLADALWTSELHSLARFDCDQPRYNLLFRMIEDEILPLCRAHGVGVIAYNPLAGGMLTGRYRAMREVQEGTRFALAGAGELYRRRYWQEEVFDVVDRLATFLEGAARPDHPRRRWPGCWRSRGSPARSWGPAAPSNWRTAFAPSI